MSFRGAVYSSWGWRGLDELRPQLLAMLVANLPAAGDGGVGGWVREFAGNEVLFADGDASLRRIDSALKAYAQGLGEQLDQNLFERGIHALAPDADVAAARTRLQAILADAIAVIHEHRTQRLRALPIDREKWSALTEAVSNVLGSELSCFRDFSCRKNSGADPDPHGMAREWDRQG
jgi:hypothetical protein